MHEFVSSSRWGRMFLELWLCTKILVYKFACEPSNPSNLEGLQRCEWSSVTGLLEQHSFINAVDILKLGARRPAGMIPLQEKTHKSSKRQRSSHVFEPWQQIEVWSMLFFRSRAQPGKAVCDYRRYQSLVVDEAFLHHAIALRILVRERRSRGTKSTGDWGCA